MEEASHLLRRLVSEASPNGLWPSCHCGAAMTIVMVWTKHADLPTPVDENAVLKCQTGRCRQRVNVKLNLSDEQRMLFETTDLVPVNGKNK